MRIVKGLGLALAAAIVAMAAFLAWRVMDARARSPALVAALVAKADPQIAALPKARTDLYLRVEDPTFWTRGVDLKTPGAGQTTTSQGWGS